MTNLLADANNWQSWHGLFDGSYVGPPSAYWDAATSSYYLYADYYGPAMVEMRLTATPSSGDVVAGQFEPLTIDINSTVPTLGFYAQDGTQLQSVSAALNQRASFSFPAVSGMRIGTALSGVIRYAGESRIFVPQPTPPPPPPPNLVSKNPSIPLPVQLRGYVAADTPQMLWARGETGPTDFTGDTVVVRVRRYSHFVDVMEIAATTGASGQVSFVVPAALGTRYGRGLYWVTVVSAANGVTHDGTLEIV
ncbi:hypothetical protein [Xanthomonas albilineans]|uniref:hypothetical protein n=1 Tax=Xanthomonas albilineans TaxID=29447 RepID=UPI0009BA9EB2|nr:hypothetical protein [Xanthomonas albilineans]